MSEELAKIDQEFREAKARIRADAGTNYETKERRVRALGLEYDRKRKELGDDHGKENGMTTTKKRKAESVEDLDARIEEMEAELEDHHGKPLSWEEVTTTTADELAAKEGRRRILPRLITAAKIKRLELLQHRYEAEHAPLQEKIEETYAAYQEAEERLRAAQEKRNAANGAWNTALEQERNAQIRIKRTKNEIADLKGAR